MSTGVEITDDDGPGGSHKRGTWAWYRGVGGACGHLESSCHTDHVTDHALITWLSCTANVADNTMIT